MRTARIDEIEKFVFEHKTVTLDQLCATFNVSKNTIRRDVEELLLVGNIKKIYGGITLQNSKELTSFDDRYIKNLKVKKMIAQKAAELVEDDDIIFIDSGTTTCFMINYINDRKNLTIITNNIKVIIDAIPYENINILSISGTLNRKTLSFSGKNASSLLSEYNISKAFMSSTGITIKNGVTNSSQFEYEVKKTAIERSKEVILLVDNSKLGVISLMTYCELESIDTLVTNGKLPKEYTDFFQKNNHRILIAEN